MTYSPQIPLYCETYNTYLKKTQLGKIYPLIAPVNEFAVYIVSITWVCASYKQPIDFC